jgi:signal transduction histidine kinase
MDFRECLIYRQLKKKSSPGDGAIEKLDILVEQATPLLDSIISGPFKHFTLHNRDHAKKLLHLCEYVIDASTRESLSALEILVIAYSAYLHDLGMSITSPEERARILESQDFQDVLSEWPELSEAFQRSRKRLQEIVELGDSPESPKLGAAAVEAERLRIEGELFQLQEAAFVTYLRPRHATEQRYRELISLLKKASGRNDLFEFRGVSFEQHLINICASHNLDAGVLAEVRASNDERFPRQLVLSSQRLNSQFCAAVLRITDVLDFDRERTPRVLFESLGISSRALPGAEVSLEEWQKHMAVHSLDIRKDEIVIAAESKHPAIEKSIREFCQLIEREVRDTSTVLAHNTGEIAGIYKLQLPVVVRPQVTSVGYIYKEMSLVMNQVAIMSLLMGEHLYSQKGVALRELIQNSVDACVAQAELSSNPDYKPAVKLGLYSDAMKAVWIEITDNGIGMDEHVLSEYFLKLGNSYYRSAEFFRLSKTTSQGTPFVPIARFGIGVASLFMVGDVVEVLTRASKSPRLDSIARLVRIERMGGLVFVEENLEWDAGTRIRVRLRPDIQNNVEQFLIDVRRYLRTVVVRPKVNTTVNLTGKPFDVNRKSWLGLNRTATAAADSLGLEIVSIPLEGLSQIISGIAFLILRKTPEGLSLVGPTKKKGWFHDLTPELIFDGYEGNRVTVNGFKMTLKGQKRLHSMGKIVLPLAFDIEVQPDSSVVFDVSRDRLIGQTKPVLVNEFRSTVYRSLLQLGILDKLDRPSRGILESILLSKFPPNLEYKFRAPIRDEVLLGRVQAALPKDHWPQGIHKTIARDLDLAPNLVSRTISTLIDLGLVSKPSSNT